MNPFEKLVQKMRETQKEYFATRSKAALIQSKELEKEVDLGLFNKGEYDKFLNQLASKSLGWLYDHKAEPDYLKRKNERYFILRLPYNGNRI